MADPTRHRVGAGATRPQARDPRGPPGLEGKGRAFGGGVALGHLGVRPLTFSLWR